MGKTYKDTGKYYLGKNKDIPKYLKDKLPEGRFGHAAGLRWGNSRKNRAKDSQILNQIERSQLNRKIGKDDDSSS
ncbi:hypothetical protein NVP2275O_321 [Vibrio phage 2.275.O._10N.286.54.E11]|nr:hypothetical protein NVP2275O_321 [Vibrio phage 2.275.O._10N.286.54.E11]